MPIIREFRCYEDASGNISGFEIDYWYKPAIVGFNLPAKFWKTLARRGSAMDATTRTLMVSSSDSIQ